MNVPGLGKLLGITFAELVVAQVDRFQHRGVTFVAARFEQIPFRNPIDAADELVHLALLERREHLVPELDDLRRLE